jgi:hypothetical protein
MDDRSKGNITYNTYLRLFFLSPLKIFSVLLI